MRLCDLLPPPPQHEVQHLKQQQAHSAPQHMHRAMQVITEKRMRPPIMIAAMTGHLRNVSKGRLPDEWQ